MIKENWVQVRYEHRLIEHFTIQSSKDDAVAKLQQFRELNPQLTYRLCELTISVKVIDV